MRPAAGRDRPAPTIEAPAPLAAWRLDVEGDAFVLLEWPLRAPALSPAARPLTSSEKAVALRAGAGISNGDIARDRRSSTRTVANQVASAFHKLGVHSRAELAALLSRCEGKVA